MGILKNEQPQINKDQIDEHNKQQNETQSHLATNEPKNPLLDSNPEYSILLGRFWLGINLNAKKKFTPDRTCRTYEINNFK